MKTLFIYHNINTKNIRHFPFGIGVLSSFLKKHGHETEVLYVHEELSEDALLSYVGTGDPDLIAFSAVTHQWPYARDYARIIKKKFHVPIICGGTHATFMPEEVINEPAIDLLCIGEGEYALLEFLDRMENGGDLSTVPNIWVKNEEGTIFRNEMRELISDLDSLPFPDREIVPFQQIISECNTEPVFMSTRGCPFNCRFCSNSAIKRLYQGKGTYVRQRSPENVIREIGELRDKYRFDALNFYDECFGFNRKWLERFCEMYKSEFSYPFGCFIRAETMDRKTFRMMRKAGLALIYLGIESGNEALRRKVMNRQVSDERIIRACRDAQAEGIQVWTYNIVGIPGETRETIRQAMELNRIINPHFVSISIYQPLPGTELYEECVKYGYIKRDFLSSFYEDSVLDLPTISHDELLVGFREFQDLSTELRVAHEKKGDKIFLADI
ncbi:MAG: radical SAM protein [Thermodesulfobacteriota bacterium]|nr:radical SAM protein [Thermodesulfobacteriota bacterium]